MRRSCRPVLATIIVLTLTVLAGSRPATAVVYPWTENDRLTWVHPELQHLTLGTADVLWIGPDGAPGSKMIADQVVMTNHGVITWADNNSTMYVGVGSNLDNHGLIDLQAAGEFWRYGGGNGWNTLTNRAGATLRKSVSAGDVHLPFANQGWAETQFVNAGTLECQTGRILYSLPLMYFQDGTRFTGPGTHLVGVSHLTEFQGSITVDPGTGLVFDATITPGESSSFRGAEATLHGRVEHRAGALTEAWTIAADGLLEVPATCHPRSDATLTVEGAILLHGDLYSSTVTTNRGQIVFLEDDIRLGRGDGSWPTLVNEGVIQKAAGNGTCGLEGHQAGDVNLVNSALGTIDALTGTLRIHARDFAENHGRMHTAAGARIEIINEYAQSLVNYGRIDGSGEMALPLGQPLVNLGTLSPGEPAGTEGAGLLTISTSLAQGYTGELSIDLGGASPQQSDLLAVTGTANLGGRLRVRTEAGYLPADGAVHQILTCAARTGGFDLVDLELPAGYLGEVIYGAAGVSIRLSTATSGVPGTGGMLTSEPRLSLRPVGHGTLAVTLDLPASAEVRIGLYSIGGRAAAPAIDATFGAGRHRWQWSPADPAARPVTSGSYVARAEVRTGRETRVLRARAVIVR